MTEFLKDDPLKADALLAHVRHLAETIGPRQAAHPEEEAARTYVKRVLEDAGVTMVESQPFRAPDSIAYSWTLPIGAMILGNLLSLRSRAGRLVGGALTLGATAALTEVLRGAKHPLAALLPKGDTANVIARIPASGERHHRVVLVGHVDSARYRTMFEDRLKGDLVANNDRLLAIGALNGLMQIAQVPRFRWWAGLSQALTAFALSQVLSLLQGGEKGELVAGANDNATAVACLLGIAQRLQAQPLEHTEVWLAFTGAEETGLMGIHHLLDVYGDELRNAWFVDFEMVGSAALHYVTRHSGMSRFSAYEPDLESLTLAERVAAANPELGVTGAELTILEEVGALRSRGFRALCIAGAGPDGWLENWHLPSDTVENINADGVERAARFAMAMLETLDRTPTA